MTRSRRAPQVKVPEKLLSAVLPLLAQTRSRAGLNNNTPRVDWSQARCAATDSDMFFAPTAKDRDAVDTAKRLCWECPIRTECLTWSLAHEPDGVWGGLSAPERWLLGAPRPQDRKTIQQLSAEQVHKGLTHALRGGLRGEQLVHAIRAAGKVCRPLEAQGQRTTSAA